MTNNLARALARTTLTLLLAVSTAKADCVSSLQQISDFFTTPNRAAGPIAINGNRLGVVLNETTPPRPIYFAGFDTNLNRLSEDHLVASTSREGAFRTFWTGNGYGVFFFEPGGQLMFQRLSVAGEAVGSVISVGALATFPEQEADVVFDTTRNAYLVVHTITQGASVGFWLTILGVEGNTISDDRLGFEISSPSEPRIAVAADGTIAILRHQREANDGLRLSILNANRVVSAFADLTSNARRPVFASNGTSFAAVWQSTISGGTELRWARTDAQARVLQGETRFLSGRGTDVAPVSLIWNPTSIEWGLTYLDSPIGFVEFSGDLRLRRFATAGALISDTAFSSDLSRVSISSRFPFVWSGDAYIASADRFLSNQGSISFLEKHCTLAATATASRISVSAGTPVTLTASATGGTEPYAYSWDFGDLTDKR
ncbi:MAG: hypothetical protein JOZ54_08790, partial [Acidobacteria bacterium]|nr:hypothetical protein [Acidobacteriota bacterium]